MIGTYYIVEPTKSVVPYDAILKLATKKFAHKTRIDGSPYIGHCVNVGELAGAIAKWLGEDDIGQSVCRCAGIGHDLFEDTDTDFEDVSRVTCDEVAAIVSWVSDDKSIPVKAREDAYFYRLIAAPIRAQIVKLADLIDNSSDAILLFGREQPPPINFLRRWVPRSQMALARLIKVKYKEAEVRLIHEASAMLVAAGIGQTIAPPVQFAYERCEKLLIELESKVAAWQPTAVVSAQ